MTGRYIWVSRYLGVIQRWLKQFTIARVVYATVSVYNQVVYKEKLLVQQLNYLAGRNQGHD